MTINAKEIFSRMDIQQIRSFVLNGVDSMEMYNCTYDERLEKGNALMIKRLKKLYKNEDKFSDATDDLCYALLVNSEIYTEIGMKIGARLLLQLLYENDI